MSGFVVGQVVVGQVLAPFGFDRLAAVQFEVGPTVIVVIVVTLYLVGAHRISRSSQGPWPARRTVAFLIGAIAVLCAVDSVVGLYDDVLFADHVAQHLILIMVAAPCVAMGAPVDLCRRATGGATHRLVTAALDSRFAHVAGHPITGFAVFAVLMPAAHLTALYNVTLTNEAVHDAEHAVFLVVGYLFWRPVVAIEPSRHHLSPGIRLLYLALALPIEAFTGLALVSATHELFPAYRSIARSWGPSLTGDLHDGGAVMVIAGDALMVVAMIPVAIQWVCPASSPGGHEGLSSATHTFHSGDSGRPGEVEPPDSLRLTSVVGPPAHPARGSLRRR